MISRGSRRFFWILPVTIFSIWSIFGSAVVTQAQAQQRSALAYNWTGFYAGLHGGGAWLTNDASVVTVTTAPTPTDPAFLNSNTRAGGLLGAHAGYNWQLQPFWIVGIEGDFSWSSAKNNFNTGILNSAGVPLPANNFATLSDRINWLASMRARLGYTSGPWMYYLTAGGALAGVDYHAVRSYAAIPPNNIASFSTTSGGWVVGGGLDFHATRNIVIRAEYLHYGFPSKSATTTCTGGCGITPPVIDYSWGRLAVDAARIAVSYQF